MQLFLDTANVEEVRTAAGWGVISGVTTNPSLVAKEGKDFREVVKEICAIVKGPTSAEVTVMETEAMIRQAKEISQWDNHVVIKLPLTENGIAACKELSAAGIKTNVTLCFSVNQAILAANAGATYVSPFVGRLDDIKEDGMALVADIRKAYDNYDYKTKLLAASIRSAEHARKAALVGADAATVPFKVLREMFRHPLTDAGIEKFAADWAKMPPSKS
jgi:transaldolase